MILHGSIKEPAIMTSTRTGQLTLHPIYHNHNHNHNHRLLATARP